MRAFWQTVQLWQTMVSFSVSCFQFRDNLWSNNSKKDCGCCMLVTREVNTIWWELFTSLGRTTITFTRPAAATQAGDANFAESCYYLLLPDRGGPLANNYPGYHAAPTYSTPAFTDQLVCIASCTGKTNLLRCGILSSSSVFSFFPNFI